MAGLGRLVATLGMETAEFESGLNKADKLLIEFNTTAAAKFAAVATTVQRGVNAAIDEVVRAVTAIPRALGERLTELDEVNKLSERFGLAAKEVQTLGYAFKLADGSQEGLAKGLKELSKNLVEAAAGGKEQQATFRALGIDAKEALKSPSEAVLKLAEGLEKIENPMLRVALAQRALGKAAAEWVPFLQQGREEIAASVKEIEEFGAVASDKAVRAAADFKDNLDRLSVAGLGWKNAILEGVLPTANALIKAWLDMQKGAGGLRTQIAEFTKDNALFDWIETAAIGFAKLYDTVARFVQQSQDRWDELKGDLLTVGAAFKVFWAALVEPFGNIPNRIREIRQELSKSLADIAAEAEIRRERAGRPLEASVREFFAQARVNLGNQAAAPRKGGGDVNALAAITQTKEDPFERQILDLEKDAAKLKFQIDTFERFKGSTEAAKRALVEFEITFGKFSDEARKKEGLAPLTLAQKEKALFLADEVGLRDRDLNQRKELAAIDDRIKAIDLERDAIRKTNAERQLATELDKLIKAGVSPESEPFRLREQQLRDALRGRERERETVEIERFVQQERDVIDTLKAETDALTLLTSEQQKLAEARRIDRQVRDFTRNPDGSLKVDERSAREVTIAAEAAKDAARRAIDERRALERDALTGAKVFFRDYIDSATNAAAQVQTSLGNIFSGLTDQLDQLLATGRVTARDFVEIFNREFRRLIVRQIMTEIAKSVEGLLNSLSQPQGSGTSGLVNLLGSLAVSLFSGGSGNDIAGGGAGQNVITTPAVDPNQGITVQPLSSDASGVTVQPSSAGSQTLNQTIYVDGRSDQAQLAAIAENATRRGMAEMQRDFSSNGSFRQTLGSEA